MKMRIMPPKEDHAGRAVWWSRISIVSACIAVFLMILAQFLQ